MGGRRWNCWAGCWKSRSNQMGWSVGKSALVIPVWEWDPEQSGELSMPVCRENPLSQKLV